MRYSTALLFLSLSVAEAGEVGVSGGEEQFLWREYGLNGGRILDEAGLRAFVELDYRHRVTRSTEATYTARLYGGDVDYTGALLDGEPYTTTTAYWGQSVEALLSYEGRRPSSTNWTLLRASRTSVIFGIGLDSWSRDLEGPYGYQEEYEAVFWRLGLSESAVDDRWRVDLGAKKPFSVSEEVHLCDGVRLEPEAVLSLFWDIAYRLSASWTINLYYDSFRFDPSRPSKEPITCGGVLADINGDGRVPDYVMQPTSKLDIYGLNLRYNF